MPIDAVMRRLARHNGGHDAASHVVVSDARSAGFIRLPRHARNMGSMRTRSSANWRWPLRGKGSDRRSPTSSAWYAPSTNERVKTRCSGPSLRPMSRTGRIICSGSAISGRPSSTGRGVIKGRPVPAHVPLGIEAVQLRSWLQLFEETARDVMQSRSGRCFHGKGSVDCRQP